ncbi:hypothetical protein V7183_16230 [Bacillus sp. JJ1127]|uniref:hypothetical protein n=1 Tax=Bacillus sp. JJ1127 TaxID=3122952 RepID=UPI002FFF4EEA
MKKSLLFFCLLFLVSCQLEPLPKMTVKVDGQSLEVYEGSYCWGSKCVDKIGPRQIAAKHTPIIVPKNSKAVFSVNSTRKQKSIDVTMFHNGADIPVALNKSNTIPLPNEPGTYVYHIGVFWEQGDAGYIFQVKVE